MVSQSHQSCFVRLRWGVRLPAASNIRAVSIMVKVWFSFRSVTCGTLPNSSVRFVAVLEILHVDSAVTAVRVSVVKEIRNKKC